MAALRSAIERQRARVQLQPKKWTDEQREHGLDKAARRVAVQLDSWREQERTYSAYARALSRLLTLEPHDFDRRKFTAEDLIPKRAMGDANSVHELENYVIGPAAGGLVLAPDGSLDFTRSFERVNYPPLLAGLSVRNNVQPAVGSHPVDFLAMSIPKACFSFPPGEAPTDDPVWLYSSEAKQALILSRGSDLRYIPVRSLHQAPDGAVHFESATFAPGFPLHFFEDQNLAVPPADREAWLNSWHSELDWFHATHRTAYSDAMIALHEQFLPPILGQHSEDPNAALLARFNQRRRRLAESDFLIFANDHWNFNVRNFNPGGNHGSFLRASMHAILLFAGGDDTGIPRHMEVEEPYDSLSFVPTLLDLAGKPRDAAALPGRPIQEVLGRTHSSSAAQTALCSATSSRHTAQNSICSSNAAAAARSRVPAL